MICTKLSSSRQTSSGSAAKLALSVLLLGTVLGVTACGNKDKQAGQTLVRVNGEEITVLQVNDELRRAGVKPDQQEAATGQLLESLIDRQLILAEAMRNEVDRTTGVVQAIERAKAQIIAQAYVRSLDSKVEKVTPAEIDDYYQKHPEYFAQRKQYDVQQLVIATKDFSKEMGQIVGAAKSLDAIAAWMDAHNIRHVRGQMSRASTDLPEQIVVKLKDMQKGQIFVVNEGENSMINLIANIKINPVSAKEAAPQIEQFLTNKKVNEMVKAELTHLRAAAKIEYLNASAPVATK